MKTSETMVRHTELNENFALRLRGIFLVRNYPKTKVVANWEQSATTKSKKRYLSGKWEQIAPFLLPKCSHFAPTFCKLPGIFQSGGQYS